MNDMEKTDLRQGLSRAEVVRRLKAGLGNRVKKQSSLTAGQIILRNCVTFFNLVFAVMAVLMLLVGSSILNLTFLMVVFINTVIGCVQELRAKRAVDKLTLVAAQSLNTLRDGQMEPVRSDLLVQGDIVEYTPGDQICADGILREGQLQVNESLITGEADAIVKNAEDRLLSGSFVVTGRAKVQLTHVGDRAFAARLAAEAKKDPKAAKSGMMRALDRLIHIIAWMLIPVGLLLFFNQRLTDNSLRDSVESTVAALVGMIPEGLYLLTSVALAVSALKLTKNRVLVEEMNCIETLAQVDVLCVDKTGTITEPGMEVTGILPLQSCEQAFIEKILQAMYGAQAPDNDTAKALAERFSAPTDWVCTEYMPFTSQTKWACGAFSGQGVFLVGAPEWILREKYEALRQTVETYTAAGERVLLVAQCGEVPTQQPVDPEPLALVRLSSRIRASAPETFAYFSRQGVSVKVISGDNPQTAAAVAQRAGIENARQWVDASSLHTEEAIAEAAERHTVFGRVTPEQKRQLIRAFKQQGHTVAMTGDGVNDVLAMKESDCGIAMAGGAQAAGQIAQLVLLDGDFGVMPGIVDEGRRVINNIRRTASLFLVKNIFSLGLALLTLVTGLRFPLESFHLTIVSALTIGMPGFVLAMEPNYERVTGSFLRKTLRRAFPGGITNILMVVTAQAMIAVFQIPVNDGQAITTAILCAVGLMVLYETCRPFTKLRWALLCAMTGAVIGAFFLLPWLIGYLTIQSKAAFLLLPVVLLLAPTLFLGVNRVFAWGDRLYDRRQQKK